MQAALDDDPTQTQQQLAEALNVSQETIRGRFRAMREINKIGKWVHTISMIDKFPSQSQL